jgi:two-component system LytT family sensor kinase
MGVRWRQHELIFASIFFFLLLIKDTAVFPLLTINFQAQKFKTFGVPYSYFQHTLIPAVLSHVLPLMLLFVINLWLLPRYQKARKRIIFLLAAAVVCWFLLSTAFAISYYYKSFYLIAAPSGGSLWQKSSNRALIDALVITDVYLLYCCLREPIINWVMQDHVKRPFRVLLCNKITATAFIYSGVLLFGIMFRLFKDSAGILYLFIGLPVIIIIFINVYGLLPYREKMQIPLQRFWLKLFIAPLVLGVISTTFFILLSDNMFLPAFPIVIVILALLSFPLSWLLYVQQKDKLVPLLQLQTALGKTTADLAFLRSQINPHFLFNTLNTLYGTALQENAGRTAEGVQRLGDMMRFLLHENHRDKIPLKRELEYLNNFIALQQLRIATSKDISIQTEIDNCLHDHLIAPMLLVPFVENAYKHGIRLTTPSFIKIHFYCDGKSIYLDVVNSIHPKRVQEGMPQQSGIGLQNVKDRLQLIYPNKYTLQILEDDAAFTVHLFIQIKD